MNQTNVREWMKQIKDLMSVYIALLLHAWLQGDLIDVHM